MKLYMLRMYIIHVECYNIMVSHHLWLDVAWDLNCIINDFFVLHVGCNLVLVVNYNHKLKLFF
jgi:hypothetical protein